MTSDDDDRFDLLRGTADEFRAWFERHIPPRENDHSTPGERMQRAEWAMQQLRGSSTVSLQYHNLSEGGVSVETITGDLIICDPNYGNVDRDDDD